MISIIGIGPNRDNITILSLDALKESDVVIGYKKYVESVQDLIEDKEIIKKGMGDEIARGELAITKSIEGKKVALISSGDPGVYGMANLIFQLIGKYEEFDPKKDLRIFPGVTAVNFASSLLGAPLHDFAVISLSDILTPLSEIEKKIKYASSADFILAIYNPISKTRKKPFRRFKEILLETKDPKTLIGIVDSQESGYNLKNPPKTDVITLEELDEEHINMSTILIVGNSLTYLQEGFMITPRGYVVKSQIHPLSRDFYEKYLEGKSPSGPNTECEYYPCHECENGLQYCDLCYCPFYPCGDSSTGGKWIKNKNVWSCEDCQWIHEKKTVECVKKGLNNILEEVDDLKSKKKDLLKLRRNCILETKNKKY
jgi:precorrin-3B C17-methyltransferase / cobalt-factor III methyltransferase